ncbi:MAG TPA: FRG domain-containing protein [Rectinemataceae bacterium]
MREITPQLTDALKKHFRDAVARADAYPIARFDELVRTVAELSYLNRDNLLFFRGQGEDYRNKAGASSLYPSLYRDTVVSRSRLERQFGLLKELSSILVEETRKADRRSADELRRKTYVQWSILQHYQVCPTPLLDITQSLRVAASFAQSARGSSGGFVYVLGMPYLPNGISINSEQEIVNVRLLSVCPALAMRPYFQEGFLAGTPDITDNYDDKNELDFNRRLVAKFSIPEDEAFWGEDARRIPEDLLFPKPEQDPMLEICSRISAALAQAEGATLFDEESAKRGDTSGESLALRLRRRLG